MRTYTETHMFWPAIIADLDDLTETEVEQNGSVSCSDPSPRLLPAVYCLTRAPHGWRPL